MFISFQTPKLTVQISISLIVLVSAIKALLIFW